MNSTRLLLLVLLASAAACGSGATAVECSGTDTYASYGQAFMASRCTNCHQHSGQFSTQAAVLGSLNSIEAQISSGRMPEGSGLSATEQARVLAWLACGAP
jgi:hypothetical protein